VGFVSWILLLDSLGNMLHSCVRKGGWLSIPPGWLCYLPPEVIVRLRATNQPAQDLPFSFASDVYSFG